MNADRRARQKARRENAHDHQNRAARTFEDAQGVTRVQRCLFCRPTHNPNEKAQQHGGLTFRPVSGTLTWAQRAVSAVLHTEGMSQEAARKRLQNIKINMQDIPEAYLEPEDVG